MNQPYPESTLGGVGGCPLPSEADNWFNLEFHCVSIADTGDFSNFREQTFR